MSEKKKPFVEFKINRSVYNVVYAVFSLILAISIGGMTYVAQDAENKKRKQIDRIESLLETRCGRGNSSVVPASSMRSVPPATDTKTPSTGPAE